MDNQTRGSARIWLPVIILVITLWFLPQPASADPTYRCLPSCGETDGRFIAMVGSQLSTLCGEALDFEFSLPSDATSLQIGIFDGDTSGTWDYGSTSTAYAVYADPLGDGTGSFLVAEGDMGAMPDNAWGLIEVPIVDQARSPNGNYFYVLRATNPDPASMSVNAFKVRSSTAMLTMKPGALPFLVPVVNLASFEIVYPAWPALTPILRQAQHEAECWQ